jgi:hypothetical protein
MCRIELLKEGAMQVSMRGPSRKRQHMFSILWKSTRWKNLAAAQIISSSKLRDASYALVDDL